MMQLHTNSNLNYDAKQVPLPCERQISGGKSPVQTFTMDSSRIKKNRSHSKNGRLVKSPTTPRIYTTGFAIGVYELRLIELRLMSLDSLFQKTKSIKIQTTSLNTLYRQLYHRNQTHFYHPNIDKNYAFQQFNPLYFIACKKASLNSSLAGSNIRELLELCQHSFHFFKEHLVQICSSKTAKNIKPVQRLGLKILSEKRVSIILNVI